MRKYIFVIMTGLLPFLISCGGAGNSSNSPAPTPNGENTSRFGLTNSTNNCGSLACDKQTEYCYQVISGGNIINVTECGQQPGSPCVVWQKDIGNGQLTTSSCVKLAPGNLVCNGTSGAAADALAQHSDVCHDGLAGTMGCENTSVVTVSCFTE